MKQITRSLLLAGAMLAAIASGVTAAQHALTLAMANNGDMIRMQKPAGDFTAKHPDIKLMACRSQSVPA